MFSDLSFTLAGNQLRVCISKRGFSCGLSLGASVGNDLRFDNNVYRARRTVRDLCLCNPFDLFGTFTLDESKRDRFDLAEFKRTFSAWIKAYNRYHGCDIKYVLIPERHKNGAWHMHGVFMGIPAAVLIPFSRGKHPKKLVDGGFLNWEAYEKKFGFCSFGKIRDQAAVAAYVSAYITKGITPESLSKGEHLYLASKGLSRPVSCVVKDVRCNSDPVSLGFFENDFCFMKSFLLDDLSGLSDLCPEFDVSGIVENLRQCRDDAARFRTRGV